ncbi:MAG: ABC transporter ATP-binding protein, partial [Clostridia bacterium]
VGKALEMADRAYVLQTGRVVLSGTGDELLAHPDVKKAYLGM